MRNIFFDDNYQNEFMKRGYVKIPFLSDEEVAFVLNELKEMRPDDNFNPDAQMNAVGTIHTTILDSNTDYRRRAIKLIFEVFTPHVERILIDYRFLVGNFFVKPPFKGKLPNHQNYHLIENQHDTTVSVWCPLVDVDERNGTLHVVEGSHKIVPNIYGINSIPYTAGFEESLQKKYSKPIPLKAGECVIIDDSLVHWSDDNKSLTPRYAAQGVYVPAEVRPIMYYLDPIDSSKGFELFEINSDFFIEYTSNGNYGSRPQSLKSLGFVENNNREITEKEFVNLLKRGDKIRTKIYFPDKVTTTNILERIKSYINF